MYKILIDTSTTHFVMLLFKGNKLVDQDIRLNNKKNADIIASAFQSLTKNNNISLNDLSAFYTMIGPGSFTGIRTGLTFVKTLAQFSNTKILTSNTINFICPPNFTGLIKVNAKSNMSYQGNFIKGKQQGEIKLVGEKSHQELESYYQDLLSNPEALLSRFKESNEIMSIHPTYIKNPNVIVKGGK